MKTTTRKGSRTSLVPVAVCCLLLFSSNPTRANSFDLFGAGSRGASGGNTGITTAADYTAMFYNPAAVVLGDNIFGVGVNVSFNNLSIRVAGRPNGYDIPHLGPSSPAVGSEFRLRPHGDLNGQDPAVSVFFGGSVALGLPALRFAVVGALNIAKSGVQQSFFNDEREQYFSNTPHFDLLGGRVDHSIVIFGLAYQILDWVSAGAGVSFMAHAETSNFIYMDNLTDQSDIDLNVDLKLGGRWRPHLGVLFLPIEGVRVGATFRGEQLLALGVENEVQIRGLQGGEEYPMVQDLDLKIQYSPRHFAFGASYHSDRWSVVGELTYTNWARYLNHHGERAGFSNTVNPRLGFEYDMGGGHCLRLGGAFEPSPVGPQTGRTNYVDNDRLIGSTGMIHPIDFGDYSFRISWHFQVHVLIPRTELKEALDSYPSCTDGETALCDEVPDGTVNPATGEPWPESYGLQTGNPGFPGFTSGGWIASTGVEFAWLF